MPPKCCALDSFVPWTLSLNFFRLPEEGGFKPCRHRRRHPDGWGFRSKTSGDDVPGQMAKKMTFSDLHVCQAIFAQIQQFWIMFYFFQNGDFHIFQ